MVEAEEAAGGTVREAEEEYQQEDVSSGNEQPPPEEKAREATVEKVHTAMVVARSMMKEVPDATVEAPEEERP